jgi:hypothetical protein
MRSHESARPGPKACGVGFRCFHEFAAVQNHVRTLDVPFTFVRRHPPACALVGNESQRSAAFSSKLTIRPTFRRNSSKVTMSISFCRFRQISKSSSSSGFKSAALSITNPLMTMAHLAK